ncbi:MAG TPA: DUF3597 domain-containing protein [Hyphomicrobiaceae bacterium]|nr:DUF3597 domain-containing protein [Hyphomicrobiaceae bacterium]
MGIFDTIKAAIFGSEAQASPAPTAGAVAASGAAPAGKPAATVDVAANLDALAKKSKEKFDWRKSIVDLMKLLDLDSSLNARKELAKELGYTGNMSDSATMNVWLHKQVMTKLAANGGKVPDELK